jgi:hypothetical protein
MPYKSAKQRAYLHIHEPKLAAEWDKKYGGKVKKGKAKPAKAKKRPASPRKQARKKR